MAAGRVGHQGHQGLPDRAAAPGAPGTLRQERKPSGEGPAVSALSAGRPSVPAAWLLSNRPAGSTSGPLWPPGEPEAGWELAWEAH